MERNLPESHVLDAMISLLDDSEQEVVNHIVQELLRFGAPIVPLLETAWEEQTNPITQLRLEEVIHQIQFDGIAKQLAKWAAQGGVDLLEGCLIIARYQYPTLDEYAIRNEVETIRIDAWLDMNMFLTPLEKIPIVNNTFYQAHRFKPNTTNYSEPDNSFLNRVLETKTGNPISLSILYMIVAQALDLPIYGVNLPQHFVLCYLPQPIDEPHKPIEQDEIGASDALFYINAFNNGLVFGKHEINQFLKTIKLEPQPSYFKPCSHIDIVKRVLNNLLHSYQLQNKEHKAQEVYKLRQILNQFK